MKQTDTGKPLGTDLEKLRALQDEDIIVDDPDCPYDPNDPEQAEEYWKDAVVTTGGIEAVRAALTARRTRGPGKKPSKELLSVRYSPEVVEYFRDTGPGWQTRMDEALKEWIAAHPKVA